MATNNRLQLKRGAGTPGAILRAGEPAYDSTNGLLYVGLTSAATDTNTGQLIGGLSYVERVDDILTGDGNINVSGIATINQLNVTGLVTFSGGLDASGGDLLNIGAISADSLNIVGLATIGEDLEVGRNLTVAGLTTLTGALELGTSLQFGAAGQAVTAISAEVDLDGGSASDSTIATQLAIKTYVDNTAFNAIGAVSIDIEGDVGTGIVATATEALLIAGTPNEIETVGAGQSITIGLPNELILSGITTVSGTLDVDGTATINGDLVVTGDTTVGGAITFSGEIEFASDVVVVNNDLLVGGGATVTEDLTVQRNLDVVGLTTLGGDVVINGNLVVAGAATSITFDVRDVTIEDRLLELGSVAGEAPPVATDWDLGIAMNYNDAGAKKAAIVWQNNIGFNLAADISETQTTGTSDPQITVDTFAALGVNGLSIGDVTVSANQVINSEKDASFTELFIGGAIDDADNLFVKINPLLTAGQIEISNASFDGGTY